jgi:DnaJ family protein C protein 19
MTSTMDRAQACAVLGLDDANLDKAAVIAAHRRLMQHIHPDKGGSALLAQQLNEAKRILLSILTD